MEYQLEKRSIGLTFSLIHRAHVEVWAPLANGVPLVRESAAALSNEIFLNNRRLFPYRQPAKRTAIARLHRLVLESNPIAIKPDAQISIE